MKPMHIAMALLSAAMFFVLAGVFMGVQLELDGTKLVVDTASDIRGLFLPAFATCFPERAKKRFRAEVYSARD